MNDQTPHRQTRRRAAGRLRLSPSAQETQPAPGEDESSIGESPLATEIEENADQLLFTPEQAAPLLQVRPSWLRRRAAARAVPCHYLGKHLRFTREDLEEIVATSRQRSEESCVTRSGDPPVSA
ncbi:helix-turn-helix domain-containing protein [Lentzea sp. HUAS12]|uniref:helix-turn-helix domain-containing protein n=1 Tax=Lentzea sp. HUAS12 TaxID=2951806 RepID=UPI0035322BA3